MSGLTKMLVWVAVAAAIFAFLWWQGYLMRLSNYVQQTREELKKCAWPSWEELKGSTAVITISIILLGGFTVLVDFIFMQLVRLLT